MKKLLSFLFATMMAVGMYAGQNLVVNGDFSNGTDGWELNYQTKADTNIYVISTTDGLEVSQPTKASGRLDITQDIPVEKGETYTLSFEYKATHQKFRIWSFLVSDNDVWVYFTDDAKTDSLRTYNGYFAVADGWTTVSYPFSVPDVDTIPTFRLQFRVYKQAGFVSSLKNVSVVKQGGEDTPTSLQLTDIQAVPTKFIKDGHMYFNKEDMVFDAAGNRVK